MKLADVFTEAVGDIDDEEVIIELSSDEVWKLVEGAAREKLVAMYPHGGKLSRVPEVLLRYHGASTVTYRVYSNVVPVDFTRKRAK